MALRQRYNNVLRRLYAVNKKFTVTMRLDRIQTLHELVGRPLDAFETFHVTGTNGKGSVCWKTAAALEHAGYRVGLFSSPHIASFRERARVNGEIADESAVVAIMEELFDLTDKEGIQTSFFEYSTLFGLLHFARSGVDHAVLEVGCGGRLDATNICEKPAMTCITSIGLDHPNILGDTVEQVCYHKAGIMKKGVPCVVGARVPNSLLAKFAKDVGAEFVPLSSFDDASADGFELDGWCTRSTSSLLPPPPPPPPKAAHNFDQENSDLVRRMLRLATERGIVHVGPESIEFGVAQRPPYRLEEVDVSTFLQQPIEPKVLDNCLATAGLPDSNFSREQHQNPVVVFDCAHNTDAFEALFTSLRSCFGERCLSSRQKRPANDDDGDLRVRIVLGFSGEKDVRACLKQVLQHVAPARVHFVTSPHGRAVSSSVLKSIFSEEVAALTLPERQHLCNVYGTAAAAAALEAVDETLHTLDITDRAAFQQLLYKSREERDEIVLVCGTMYALGHVRKALGADIVFDDIQKV